LSPIRPLFASLFVATLSACAAEPHKQAEDARYAEMEEQRKHQEAAAQAKSDAKLTAAEERHENTTAPAGASDATKTRVEADALVQEERSAFKAKATARMEKAIARLGELKSIVGRAGGKATTASRESVASVDTQRETTRRGIAGLDAVASGDLKAAQSRVETDLDTLDSYVKLAGKEVDKFK
jgi:hypothetical protein